MFDDLDKLINGDPFLGAKTASSLHLKEGERREVAILFADCHGFTALSERLDHETVHTLMDKLMQLFTSRIKHFGGFIDKYEGDLVMALFGAKVASEQDTERAIEAGLQMLAVLEQFNRAVTQSLGFEVNISVRIGINTGEVTTGKVGEKREGDFTVYGDAVNLASRLESSAPLNRILLTRATMQRVAQAFDFEPHGSIQVKGKADPIEAWLVTASKTERLSRWQVRWTAFVGRESEMAKLQQKHERVVARLESLSTASTEKPIVIGLKGEAGMGKSRLVDEFLKQIGAESFYLHGTTPRLIQQAYGLFISMIRKQLGISLLDDQTVARQKLERGMAELSEFEPWKADTPVRPESEPKSPLHDSLPFLGNLLNLPFDDVRLTLPPKDLQPHLQTSIRYFIEACAAKTNESGEPLLVVLEDLHWADSPSLATLEFLLFTLNLEEKRRGATLKQILFLLTYRPEYSPTRGIVADSEFEEVELSTLTPDLAQALIESIVGGRGSVPISAETLALVMERSAGNPFFIEEWASYIAESKGSVAPASLSVPSTLQALILARMDQLEAELKLLLQKAAVLGREFFVNVVEAMEERLEGRGDLGGNFSILEDNKFLLPVIGRSLSAYMFKHILTQEVAYGTLLIANRKVLHRIAGEVVEELFTDQLEEHWHDLAEHYEKGEVWDKAADYLLKAADQAKDRYDNLAALGLYGRLLKLQTEHQEMLTPQNEVKARLGKGSVLELTGNWTLALEEYQRAVDVAVGIEDFPLEAEALNARGNVLEMQGEYDSAQNDFQKSLSIAEVLGDKKRISAAICNMGAVYLNRCDYDRALEHFQKSLSIAEELGDKKGISKAIGVMGHVFLNRGDYDRALEHYQKLLSIAEELGDKRRISQAIGSIGHVFLYRGDYDRALEHYQKLLSIAEELGNKDGISVAIGGMGLVYHNRGDYDRALECYQKWLSIAEELGYKLGISRVFANMGTVYRERGDNDRALDYYQRSLSIAEGLSDKWGISAVIGIMGILFQSRGDYDRALECYQKQLFIAEELGDKPGISQALGNMGCVYFEISYYKRAEDFLERSIEICRHLNSKRALTQHLPLQSRLALVVGQHSRAKELCAEALNLAHELKDNGKITFSLILSHKINFVAADDDAARAAAVDALTAMLGQTEDDEAKAEIHFELFQMYRTLGHPDHTEHHRLEAIRLYKSLYANTPKFAFKKRLEELHVHE